MGKNLGYIQPRESREVEAEYYSAQIKKNFKTILDLTTVTSFVLLTIAESEA